jgi:hypothetical protein
MAHPLAAGRRRQSGDPSHARSHRPDPALGKSQRVECVLAVEDQIVTCQNPQQLASRPENLTPEELNAQLYGPAAKTTVIPEMSKLRKDQSSVSVLEPVCSSLGCRTARKGLSGGRPRVQCVRIVIHEPPPVVTPARLLPVWLGCTVSWPRLWSGSTEAELCDLADEACIAGDG